MKLHISIEAGKSNYDKKPPDLKEYFNFSVCRSCCGCTIFTVGLFYITIESLACHENKEQPQDLLTFHLGFDSGKWYCYFRRR